MKTIYQCEYCKTIYETSKKALKCEADCLNLTEDEYLEYLDLLARKKITRYLVSRDNDETAKKLFDDCIKDVAEFQKRHGIASEDKS